MSTLIKLHPSGRQIESRPGETVLESLERAGYALPNNCRAGACGECKVKVLSGHFDQGVVLDMALSAEERKQGFGLMCMAKPLSPELVIEWGTADAKPKLFPPRENQRYVVIDRVPRTPRITEFRLRPLGQPMRYWPGQYVTLSDVEGKIPARCYSIANAPRPDGEITLQITRIEGGVTSVWIHDHLQIGDMVRINGLTGPSSATCRWIHPSCAWQPARAWRRSARSPKRPCAGATASPSRSSIQERRKRTFTSLA